MQLKYIINLSLLFSGFNHQILANRWMTLGKVINYGIPLSSALLLITKPIEAKRFKRLPENIDPAVENFCKATLGEHVNENEIFIREVKGLGMPVEAIGNDTILLDSSAINDIREALQKKDSKQLDAYRFILRHERSHLEYGDTIKNCSALFAASAAVVLVSIIVRSRLLKNHFFKNPVLILTASTIAGYAKFYTAVALFRPYQRYTESRADENAFSFFKNPTELDNTINHLRMVEKSYDDELIRISSLQEGEEEDTRDIMRDMKKENRSLYNFLLYTFVDSSHPTPQDRIQQAQQYKEKLLEAAANKQ